MRIFPLLLLLVTVTGLYADEYRKWTEAETKRQIEAQIVDKKFDDSQAKLIFRDGKVVWMNTIGLIPEDQKYIKNWVVPIVHITARVVGSSKGRKKVEVTAIAGSRKLTVKAFWNEKATQPKGYTITRELKIGEKITFIYEASNEYVVKGWSGKELVDEESWNKKTGL